LVSARRWLITAVVGAAALFMPSMVMVAQAEVVSGDSVWVGTSTQGYSGTRLYPIYENPPADPANPGEPDYWAYCIEHDVSAKTGTSAQVGDFASYLGSNHFVDPAIQGKVLWVLAHSYPAVSLADFGEAIGAPGISRNDAIEATQYAIWRYTDLAWDASWPFESADSEAAYWYLVNGANASPGLSLDDLQVTASVTAPATPQVAGSLVGPFVVSTNQPTASVTVDPAVTVVDADGAVIDTDAVVDGQEIYLDLRGSTAAGSATVTVSAQGTSATGKVISVPTSNGGTPTEADHAQSIILVSPATKNTTDEASVQWSAAPGEPLPSIGTSLVDASDQDRILAWGGGTVVDTVAYRNLVPGREYTLVGELMNKADGSPTGITGSTAFTPSSADGSVDVTFEVPAGYAGQVLVAFEELYEGADATGTPVAEHKDINDAAQTVTLEDEPTTPVVPTKPKVTTETSKAKATPGARIFDKVRISGFVPGHGATGTATLYGPFAKRSDMTCTPASAVKTVRFNPKNGVVRTPKVKVTRTGFYTWVAGITADSRNRAATHACGLKSETTLVRKPKYKSPTVGTGFSSTGDLAARQAPGSLVMPAIGARAPMTSVGIKRGQMLVPGDVARVGRLNRSAAVGDLIGTTVIAGHVSDRHDRPGAFWRLASARKGQVVTVTDAGKTVRYRVTGVERFDRNRKLPQRLFRTTGAHRLVLISCTGRVTTRSGGFHYTQNVVVTAKKLKG